MFDLAYTHAGNDDLGQRAVSGGAWVGRRVIERCCRP